MDSIKRENVDRSTRRGTGPSFRFAHFGEEVRNSGPTGHRYSSRGNDEEMRPRRPVAARPSVPGSGDVGPRSPWGRAVPSKVLVVHGMERVAVNCDQVFNLFCLYGNVAVVKVLKAKQVLVEMQDFEAAKRCVQNLNSIWWDEAQELSVKYSRHSFIDESGTQVTLSDGTPSRKSYLKSALNRFSEKVTSTDQRRSAAAPSTIIHFYNAPLDVTATDIHKAVTDALGCARAISSIAILPKKLPGTNCTTGLIEMKTVKLAVKAICLSNHMPLKSSRSRFPFTTKLCFSKWSKIQQQSNGTLKLLLNNTPCEPLQINKFKNAVPAVEFPAPRTTLQETCSDGTPWMQWDLRDLGTVVIDPAAGNPVEPIGASPGKLPTKQAD